MLINLGVTRLPIGIYYEPLDEAVRSEQGQAIDNDDDVFAGSSIDRRPLLPDYGLLGGRNYNPVRCQQVVRRESGLVQLALRFKV